MIFCPSIQNLNEYCFADVKVNIIFIVIVLKLFENSFYVISPKILNAQIINSSNLTH